MTLVKKFHFLEYRGKRSTETPPGGDFVDKVKGSLKEHEADED